MQPLFCPLPCRERAALLNKNLKIKLQESLEHLVEVNKNALGDYYSTWKKSLSKIQTDKKISSFYYSLNSLLAHESIKSIKGSLHNIPSIAQYIHALLEEASWNQDLTDGNLRFSSFDENRSPINPSTIQRKYILFDLPSDANIHAPDDTSIAEIKKLVNDAMHLIQATSEEYHQEMLELLSEILILQSEFLKAGSSFDLFGLIYINAHNAKQSLINMADLLIHETAHYYLYGLSVDDPLVLNDYNERYFSPIKGRNRPMIGIYHAAFVLFRVLKFLSLLSLNSSTAKLQNSLLRNDDSNVFSNVYLAHHKEITELNTKYSAIVSESLETVMKFGQLTELGEKLIKATEQEFIKLSFSTTLFSPPSPPSSPLVVETEI